MITSIKVVGLAIEWTERVPVPIAANEQEPNMPDHKYRRFLYVDTNEIIAHSSVMDGGEITDDVRTLTRKYGGKIGAVLGQKLIPLDVSLAARFERSYDREYKIRQTAYSATTRVIEAIKPEKKSRENDVKERMIIECDVFLQELPKVKAQSDHEKRLRDYLNLVARLRALRGRKDPRKDYIDTYGKGWNMPVRSGLLRKRGDKAWLTLSLRTDWLIQPDDFSGSATVIGQVTRAPEPESEAKLDSEKGILSRFGKGAEKTVGGRTGLPAVSDAGDKNAAAVPDSKIWIRPIAIFK